jgi:hypothetical protein
MSIALAQSLAENTLVSACSPCSSRGRVSVMGRTGRFVGDGRSSNRSGDRVGELTGWVLPGEWAEPTPMPFRMLRG